MGSDIIQQICNFLASRGYIVDSDRTPITAKSTNNPIDQTLCLKRVDHDNVRIWCSFKCPPCSDKLILLQTMNKLNMYLTVSCVIGLIEIDCTLLIGACFPYTYEENIFAVFFDRFLEDAYHCLKVIKAVIEDSDEGKVVLHL